MRYMQLFESTNAIRLKMLLQLQQYFRQWKKQCLKSHG